MSSTPWPLVLQWTAASAALTLLLWIPSWALAGSLSSSGGIAYAPLHALIYLLYSPLLAPLLLALVAPAFLLLFWLWGRAAARRPSLEHGWGPLAAAAAVVSLPPAVVAGACCAWRPAGVAWSDAPIWMVCCLAMLWGGIVLPRWLLDSLRLGVWSETGGEATRRPTP